MPLSRRRLLVRILAVAATSVAALGGAWWLRRAGPSVAFPDDVCITVSTHAHDPGSGLALLDARPIPDDARCPVCGMFPARSPRWAAQLIFSDGHAHFFDSPVNLHLYLQDIERLSRGRRRPDEVGAAYVRDFGQGQWIAAFASYYVHGSSELGPMRAGNLVPFARREDALTFARARGGRVLTAQALDPALLARLDTRSRHVHAHDADPAR
jgi:nitrous oxide reductase accessory protein NosL